MNRNAPTLPPIEGVDDDSELVTETSFGAPKPWAPPTLDSDTRELISDTIARAIAAELARGRVQIAPVAPALPSSPEPPRSSLRVAARSSLRAAAKGAGQVGKWGVFASGALSLLGSIIVWWVRPEYAAPMAQALKLIAALILSAAGGGAPAQEAGPARDVPAITQLAPAPLAPPRPPDVAP